MGVVDMMGTGLVGYVLNSNMSQFENDFAHHSYPSLPASQPHHSIPSLPFFSYLIFFSSSKLNTPLQASHLGTHLKINLLPMNTDLSSCHFSFYYYSSLRSLLPSMIFFSVELEHMALGNILYISSSYKIPLHFSVANMALYSMQHILFWNA